MDLNSLPNYTDFDSLLQVFEKYTNHYKDNVLFRYRMAGSTSLDDFKTLKYGQVDIIATRLANIWKPMIPPNTSCIAIFNEEPIQSLFAFFAALKLGLIFFPIYPHIPKHKIAHFLKKSNAGFIITPKSMRGKAADCVEAVMSERKQQVDKHQDEEAFCLVQDIEIWDQFDDIREQLMSFDSKMDGEMDNSFNGPIIPYAQDPKAILVYSTTSGSTSIYPKLVGWNTHSIMYWVLDMKLKSFIQENDPAIILESSDVVLFVSPLFFIGPSIGEFFATLLVGASMLLFDSQWKMQPHDLLAAADKFKVTSVMCCDAAVLEQLATYLKTTDKKNDLITLHRIKHCFYGGTPLQAEVGEYLRSKGLNMRIQYGSTEAHLMALAKVTKSDQHWNKISPILGLMRYATFEPYKDNIYHLVIHSDFPSLARNSGKRPNGDYETRDLFIKESEDYWDYYGRIDDILSLKSSLTVNPLPMEMNLYYNEKVIYKCVIIGENRERTAILIELDQDKSCNYAHEEVTSKVYNAIHSVNKNAEPHGVISVPDMVYILPPNKHLPLNRKDSVIRKQALEDFKQEIEKLYMPGDESSVHSLFVGRSQTEKSAMTSA